jgi:hypothetical protein
MRNFMRKWLSIRGIFYCLIPRNSLRFRGIRVRLFLLGTVNVVFRTNHTWHMQRKSSDSRINHLISGQNVSHEWSLTYRYRKWNLWQNFQWRKLLHISSLSGHQKMRINSQVCRLYIPHTGTYFILVPCQVIRRCVSILKFAVSLSRTLGPTWY